MYVFSQIVFIFIPFSIIFKAKRFNILFISVLMLHVIIAFFSETIKLTIKSSGLKFQKEIFLWLRIFPLLHIHVLQIYEEVKIDFNTATPKCIKRL